MWRSIICLENKREYRFSRKAEPLYNFLSVAQQKAGTALSLSLIHIYIEEGKEYYNTVANHIYGESHVDQVGICQIGATIAVHTGPYAIGIGCVKKYENYLIR